MNAVRQGPGADATLVRHGETEWSAAGQHTGRTDLDLTEAGQIQARALRPLLQGLHFDLVLCSPLHRALETAALAGLEVTEVVDDLREWDYGDLEGLTTSQIWAQIPGWSIWAGPWPGGETAADVAARADRVVDRILALPPGARVALVAHGHLLRVLGARWLGAEVATGQRLALSTASLSRLGWEHGLPVINRWNLTSDLSA